MPVTKRRSRTSSHRRAAPMVAAFACLMASAPVQAAPMRSNVTLIACTTGAESLARSATFQATLIRRKGTAQMAVRFSLKKQPATAMASPGADDTVVQSVGVKQWTSWKRSKRGSKAPLVVTRRIDGLSGPANWYADVEMRWYSASGKLQSKTTIRSKACMQPMYASDLAISSTVIAGGGGDSSPFYISALVSNVGRVASQPAELVVYSAGTQLARTAVPAIQPGGQSSVGVAVAGCTSGQRLTVAVEQPAGVAEVTLANNESTSLTCP